MNFQEILEKLKEYYSKQEWDENEGDEEEYEHDPEYPYADVDAFAYDDNWENKEIPGIGKMEEVEQEGGEGQGDDWYSVKYFPDHDVYIRIDGWYSSGGGTSFDDGWESCYEVRPKQKTITVYEAE